MGRVNLRVKLISYIEDPEQKCVAAVRQCYSNVGATELLEKTSSDEVRRLIEMVIKSGHTSTLEHATFTFAVEGISRICSHQLVRHRIASYSQQSQRYVDERSFNYVEPASISNNQEAHGIFEEILVQVSKVYGQLQKLGIKNEDARFVLPNACETRIVITMNARELLETFFRERLCSRAQWEIRAMAEEMLRLVKKVAPNIFRNAGPSCLSKGVCFEEKSCGKWRKIEGAVHKR